MQAMRRHYDKHANANLDSRQVCSRHRSPPLHSRRGPCISSASIVTSFLPWQAKQAREKGVAAPLKKFHNTIKRQLINRSLGATEHGSSYSLLPPTSSSHVS